MPVNFATVSSTARLTAYMRQYSDIPFAKDVARHLRAKEAFDALLRDMQMTPEDLILYAPIFEIRYKTQDPGITYVETDLEELTREKALLVSEICLQPNLTSRGNFHLMAANALDRQQLQAAVKHFRRDRPIAVVNEGLLLYLSASEMQTVARNIRDLPDHRLG